jgi:ribonuclease HI
MKLKIYSDGACRGNPGPSAIAYVILDYEGKLRKEHSEYIGIGTNNQAEYRALILALESAVDFSDEAVCYSDSVLVVRQMNGEWRVKHPNMIPLWREAIALKENFQKVSFVHVPRTDMYIERIDQLANQELDRCMHNERTS